MKIDIITFHFAYNCGAVLQCLALQEYTKSLGNDVEIINYRPWYHENRYTPFKNLIYLVIDDYKRLKDKRIRNVMISIKESIKRGVNSWLHYKRRINNYRLFNRFINNYLSLTRVYRSVLQLKVLSPKADVYISGSDQLWNTNLTEGNFDPAYFLDFGKKDTARITYAVGVNFENEKKVLESFAELAKRINRISLREEKYRSVIERVTGRDVSICIDPTFLLSKERYVEFESKERLADGPFVFVYTMPDSTQHKVNNAAKILGKKKNLSVIDGNGMPNSINKRNEKSVVIGPSEFLWYIRNAEYVITNSFHGTVFSVIFEKKFVAIPHSKTGNRVIELLERIGLIDRCINCGNVVLDIIDSDIDYDLCNEKIKKIVEESQNYIMDSIANVRGEMNVHKD